MVNVSRQPTEIKLVLQGMKFGQKAQTLTLAQTDDLAVNSFTDPRAIAPKYNESKIKGNTLSTVLLPRSVSFLILNPK